MIKKKELDLDSLVKASLNKAFVQHGLLKEADEKKETSYAKDIESFSLVPIKGEPEKWGKAVKISTEDLRYVTQKIRQLAGVTGQANIEQFKNIIAKFNEILGYRVSEAGGRSVESGTRASNLNELTTALALAEVIKSVISEHGAQEAGGVYEGFISALLAGQRATKDKTSPIQDIFDEGGNFISLKLIKEGAGIEGSKLGLAIGIGNQKNTKGQVTYLVTEKSSEQDPLKISFKSFVVDKVSFFPFITNEISYENNQLVGKAAEFALAVVRQFNQTPAVSAGVAPNVYSQQQMEEWGKRIAGVKAAETRFPVLPKGLSVNELVSQIIKKKLGPEATQKQINSEIDAEKEKAEKQIDEIATKLFTSKLYEKYTQILGDYIKTDDEGNKLIVFGSVTAKDGKEQYQFQPIYLSSKESFSESMKRLIINDSPNKAYKDSAFPKIISKVKHLIQIEMPDTKEIDKILELANKFENNQDLNLLEDAAQISKELQEEQTRLSDELKQYGIDFQSIGFPINGNYVQMLSWAVNQKINDSDTSKIKTSLADSYDKYRKPIYNGIEESINDAAASLFKPFLDWYKEQERDISERHAEAYSTQIADIRSKYPTGATSDSLLDAFWQTLKDKQVELSAGLKFESKGGFKLEHSTFEMSIATVKKITQVDEAYQPILLDKIKNKKIAARNVKLFENALMPYMKSFAKIKEGTNKYFIGDDLAGLVQVDEATKEIQDLINKPDSPFRQGGKLVKSSEIENPQTMTEALNMIHEAAIVFEMLNRLED